MQTYGIAILVRWYLILAPFTDPVKPPTG